MAPQKNHPDSVLMPANLHIMQTPTPVDLAAARVNQFDMARLPAEKLPKKKRRKRDRLTKGQLQYAARMVNNAMNLLTESDLGRHLLRRMDSNHVRIFFDPSMGRQHIEGIFIPQMDANAFQPISRSKAANDAPENQADHDKTTATTARKRRTVRAIGLRVARRNDMLLTLVHEAQHLDQYRRMHLFQIDMIDTTPEVRRMLTHLMEADARVAEITVAYELRDKVPGLFDRVSELYPAMSDAFLLAMTEAPAHARNGIAKRLAFMAYSMEIDVRLSYDTTHMQQLAALFDDWHAQHKPVKTGYFVNRCIQKIKQHDLAYLSDVLPARAVIEHKLHHDTDENHGLRDFAKIMYASIPQDDKDALQEVENTIDDAHQSLRDRRSKTHGALRGNWLEFPFDPATGINRIPTAPKAAPKAAAKLVA